LPLKGGKTLVKAKQKGVNFTKKGETVAEIENYLKGAKSTVFMNYRGINTAEDTALRSKFRKENVVYKVYKNNLVKIALNNLGVTELDDKLNGTLSIAFSNGDEVAAAKIIKGEKFKNKMSFEFGLVGKSVLDKNEVIRLASMPNKETLIAQIMGLINGGARSLASVINAVPRNLAVVINTRASK
jgi:large subunit ribosomal protein L10